jgi:hypothetical protein
MSSKTYNFPVAKNGNCATSVSIKAETLFEAYVLLEKAEGKNVSIGISPVGDLSTEEQGIVLFVEPYGIGPFESILKEFAPMETAMERQSFVDSYLDIFEGVFETWSDIGKEYAKGRDFIKRPKKADAAVFFEKVAREAVENNEITVAESDGKLFFFSPWLR